MRMSLPLILLTHLVIIQRATCQLINLCDDNTQLEVVFKLYGHQGQARYGVPLELARTYDGQVLMSGTSNNSSEIHGCIERHMTQEAMRIYPTSLVNTQGVTMTVSIKQQQHFVILHFCSSVTCAIPENRLSSCGNNGTFLVNLGVHSGSGGGFWLEEIEWTLREGGALYLSGYAPFDGILCLQNSTTYVLEMYDSYGDGWHDNIANFEGVDINFIQSCTLPYGAYDTCTFTVSGNTCENLIKIEIFSNDTASTSWDIVRRHSSEVLIRNPVTQFCLNDGWYELHVHNHLQQNYGEVGVSIENDTITCAIDDDFCYKMCEFSVGSPDTNPLICDASSDEVMVSIEVHDSQGCGEWQYEISWVLRLYENYDNFVLSGFAPFETKLCMSTNSVYEIELFDSYGDGWHDNKIVLTRLDTNQQIASCTLYDGSFGSCYVKFDETEMDVSVHVLSFHLFDVDVNYILDNAVFFSRAISIGVCDYTKNHVISFNVQNPSISCAVSNLAHAFYHLNTITLSVNVSYSSSEVDENPNYESWTDKPDELRQHIFNELFQMTPNNYPDFFNTMRLIFHANPNENSSSSSATGTIHTVVVGTVAAIGAIVFVVLLYFTYSRGYCSCSESSTRTSRRMPRGMIELKDEAAVTHTVEVVDVDEGVEANTRGVFDDDDNGGDLVIGAAQIATATTVIL